MIGERAGAGGIRAAMGREPGRVLVRATEKAVASLGLAFGKATASEADPSGRGWGTVRVGVELRGDLVGLLLLSSPAGEAHAVAGAVAEQSLDRGDEALVLDALGELANLIAGYAATELDAEGLEVDIAPPARFESATRLPGAAFEAARISLELASGRLEVALFLEG